MTTDQTKRYVRVGFRLDDEGVPYSPSGRMIEYSVDPWFGPPFGHVILVHDGLEYLVLEEDIARFEQRIA